MHTVHYYFQLTWTVRSNLPVTTTPGKLCFPWKRKARNIPEQPCWPQIQLNELKFNFSA